MMNKKQVTITFGTSVHYFKSSVSITWDVDKNFDFKKARTETRKAYLKILKDELKLSKKFEKMTTKEIKEFLEEQNETEKDNT